MWRTITKFSKFLEAKYKAKGYPLQPFTSIIRTPLRYMYHVDPTFRHDSRFFLKPFILKVLHAMLVVTHPHDFRIHGNKILFRSYNSFMSVEGYYTGEMEHHLMQYVVGQIKPGFTMIDVGAHHGVYTVIPAYELRRHRWKGTIHAFEPNPFNAKLFAHNVKQNKVSSYVVFHKEATADKKGKQQFIFSPEENSDGQLLGLLGAGGDAFPTSAKTYTVPVTTLDSLYTKLHHVDMIKMDVQGAEILTLKGGEKLIQRDKPILIIEAVRGWKSTEKVKTFLIKHGYTLHGVDKHGKLCPWDSPHVFVSWDLVAMPKVS